MQGNEKERAADKALDEAIGEVICQDAGTIASTLRNINDLVAQQNRNSLELKEMLFKHESCIGTLVEDAVKRAFAWQNKSNATHPHYPRDHEESQHKPKNGDTCHSLAPPAFSVCDPDAVCAMRNDIRKSTTASTRSNKSDPADVFHDLRNHTRKSTTSSVRSSSSNKSDPSSPKGACGTPTSHHKGALHKSFTDTSFDKALSIRKDEFEHSFEDRTRQLQKELDDGSINKSRSRGQGASDGTIHLGILSDIVSSHRFDYVVGLIILANVMIIAAQTDWAAKNHDQPLPSSYSTLEILFTTIFVCELLLRMVVKQRDFFLGKEHGWNLFDTLVVLASLMEQFLNLFSDTKIMRVLRILRLARIVRFVRVMRLFQELRVMIWGITHSIRTLFWAVMLLLSVILIFAVFLTQAVTHNLSTTSAEVLLERMDEQELASLEKYFCSVLVTIYSLFKSICNGMDWGTLADPLMRLSPFVGFCFCFYIAFVMFALLNLITGVFVETAIKSTEDDAELMILGQTDKRTKHIKDVKIVFGAADDDHDDVLTVEELKCHLKDPTVQALFRQLDIEIEYCNPEFLLKLLDFDDSGTVDIDEFISGCARLKGHARSLDLERLSQRQRRSTQQLTYMAKELEDVRLCMSQVTRDLSILLKRQDARSNHMQNASHKSPSISSPQPIVSLPKPDSLGPLHTDGVLPDGAVVVELVDCHGVQHSIV